METAVLAAGLLLALIIYSYSAVTGDSVAKLFIGGVVPGLALALLLSLFVLMRVLARPREAPAGSDISLCRGC